MENHPWDPGVQNERTRLAWQRTTLSVLACSLIIARLAADSSIVIAIAVAIAAGVTAAGLGYLTVRRYRSAHTSLHANHPIGDGWQNLLVAALVVITALGGLAYVIITT